MKNARGPWGRARQGEIRLQGTENSALGLGLQGRLGRGQAGDVVLSFDTDAVEQRPTRVAGDNTDRTANGERPRRPLDPSPPRPEAA